jgi:NAD-dependent deacetylase
MPNQDLTATIRETAALIRSARYLTAFTGAGISVESGIPPFRGPGGLWSKYDPRMLELDFFRAHPEKSWPVIREIFYDNFGKEKPNKAHEVLAACNASSPRTSTTCTVKQVSKNYPSS